MTKRTLHNSLFVEIITNNRVLIKDMLTSLIRTDELMHLDFRTLASETTVFSNTDGDERRADAVISVKTRDGHKIIFLIEHKSSQDKALLAQLLNYQALLETHFATKVIPIVLSNAKGRWRLPMRFRGKHHTSVDTIGSDVALDFGYKLLHLKEYSQDEIAAMFPNSYPYMLALQCIRELTHTNIANFFRSSMMLELDKRLRLLGKACDCFSKYDSDFNWDVLEGIEAEAITQSKDRVMERIKLGQEGWLEEGLTKGRQEGRQESVEEIALRMLEDGMDIEVICRITKLNRSTINKLGMRRKKKA